MQIFVINLDHKPMRWQRMAGLLQGLQFKRIAAVDGKTIDGLERNDLSLPRTPAKLARYHRATILSHCIAMREFLAGTDRYCCVLEDDVFLSPDFSKFVSSEDWIPEGCNVVKLETTLHRIWFSGKRIACLDRRGELLRSLHLGSAGYIVNRRAAQIFLDASVEPVCASDRILFNEAGLQLFNPVYQLIPALCIQAFRHKDGMIFPEMESSTQRIKSPSLSPPRKTLAGKARQELVRPFRQLKELIEYTGQRLKGLRRAIIPFA